MRGKGINYDTGFYPGGESSREQFDADVVRREMRVIARELHCTAVRISGGEPARLSTAAELATAEGLEVWFSPFPCELTTGQLEPLFAECADRAEHLRRGGANVVLVTGCELTLFAAGFLPGGTVYERIEGLKSGSQQLYAAFGALPGKLNSFLATTAEAARGRFAGPLTYAAGMWEPVGWAPFDIAAVDAYRDAGNAGTFRSELRKQLKHGKPLAVTEFGCCGYAGAGDRGGLGWAIIDASNDPPGLDGDYVRDESEQVRYLEEVNAVFADEGVDLAFWFTFAGYRLGHDPDPRRDLDMASYGVVKMLPGGPGTGYGGLGWEPKLAFGALAQVDWRAGHAT
ncbi:MAG TPA: hypothetical protein VEC76_03370 [Streptosporangiaceae bacterium]|nr:hypothetical protein [Streptosporangiaceae bacterium]